MTNRIDADILDFLKANGPRLDAEIAAALRMPLARVRTRVAEMSSSGDLICCSTVRFEGGVRTEGLSCRLSCYTPPAARGRKPGAKKSGQPPGSDTAVD